MKNILAAAGSPAACSRRGLCLSQTQVRGRGQSLEIVRADRRQQSVTYSLEVIVSPRAKN